jgi:hypothetical protein
MAARMLLENEYVTVALDRARGHVVITRLGRQFESPAHLTRVMAAAFKAAMASAGPGGLLLMDLRQGPGRNEPEYERAINALVAEHLVTIKRIAVLVRSAVGKLQVQRLRRRVSETTSVFMEEEDALEFLQGGT